jgi:hypothetical protein
LCRFWTSNRDDRQKGLGRNPLRAVTMAHQVLQG